MVSRVSLEYQHPGTRESHFKPGVERVDLRRQAGWVGSNPGLEVTVPSELHLPDSGPFPGRLGRRRGDRGARNGLGGSRVASASVEPPRPRAGTRPGHLELSAPVSTSSILGLVGVDHPDLVLTLTPSSVASVPSW